MDNHSNIDQRKKDHLIITSKEDVKSSNTTGLEKFRLIHNALPEINLSEIDTSTTIFGKKISVPVLISSMTGGTEESRLLN